MKKLCAIVLLVFFIGGCSYGAEQLKSVMSDPHYASYKEKLDGLEESYLKKELTYAQYLDKKKQVDDDYAKEVQERENIIHQQ